MKKPELTSNWPLPPEGLRLLSPKFLVDAMAADPLSRDLYPLASGFYPQARRHRMARQQNANYLLIYCTAGQGQLKAGDKQWAIKPGDIISLPEGLAHSYRADPKQPWTIYWAHYSGTLAREYSQRIGNGEPFAQIGLQPRLIADFEALFALRRAGYAADAYIHSACQLKQMLSFIAYTAQRHQAQHGQSIDLAQVEELMHLHLGGSLNLQALADDAKLSKYHFTRKFKQLTGHSPIQHFIHLKMQLACQLLDSTANSVKQIAVETGYKDAYYFSRLFKQVIGISPSEYRRSKAA
ncbi:MAG: helix-turn-helix domain-containing protein [Candidatus Reddybacter sp.]